MVLTLLASVVGALWFLGSCTYRLPFLPQHPRPLRYSRAWDQPGEYPATPGWCQHFAVWLECGAVRVECTTYRERTPVRSGQKCEWSGGYECSSPAWSTLGGWVRTFQACDYPAQEHLRCWAAGARAPPWVLFMLLAAYPIVAFVRGPVRHWRHRRLKKRGSCIRCAYDLTGNVTGVCPECGTAISETPKASA